MVEIVAVDRPDVIEAKLLEQGATGPEVAAILFRKPSLVIEKLRAGWAYLLRRAAQFQYSKSIMTNPKLRANIKGYPAFLAEAKAGKLPAVSYVKPDTTYDGHPASSTLPAFEAFLRTTLNAAMSNPKEWASTAVFVTMDESGGYYDSSYIEPISFFGDGPRDPDDRRLALGETQLHKPHLRRPRLHPQVHRGELGPPAADGPEPRQPAQPGGFAKGSLRPDERAGDREPDGLLQLLRGASSRPPQPRAGHGEGEPAVLRV